MGIRPAGPEPEATQYMKIKFHICCLAVLLNTSPVHAGNMTLEIIPLQHRMTDDVVDILRPLVAPGGTVTGMNNQLIIKTTPENLAELKTVIQSLDRTPRQLIISVRQNSGGRVESQQHSVDGRYSTGDVTIGTGGPHRGRDGLVISAEDADGNVIRYQNRNSVSRSTDDNMFTVHATEGYPALINTGQSIPVPNRTAYASPGGVVVTDSVEYINANSGFYVLPRLNGDQVTLLVAPRLTRVAPGRAPILDVKDVETTATGHLGEWIELGGIYQNFRGSNRETLSSSNVSSNELHSVLIKVDEIK